MMNPTTHRIAAFVALLLCVSSATLADPPPGYYATVDATNSTTLRTTLHAVIDDHLRLDGCLHMVESLLSIPHISHLKQTLRPRVQSSGHD